MSHQQPTRTTGYAAICTRVPGNDLTAAECLALTGGSPDADGFAFCETVARIPQAAFVRMGLKLLAYGATWPDLLQAVAAASFPAEGFRIETLSLSDKDYGFPVKRAVALANAIPAWPNLSQPQHRFVLVVRDSGLWFGEIVAECQHTYQRHDAKPHRTSTSLPSRLSRAMVNLVAPTTRSLLDPCCGTGSILLEAQALGLTTYGADRNKIAVGMARENLAHFGYHGDVALADIQSTTQQADVLVTDLPYGRFLHLEATDMHSLLTRGRQLAPLAVYVTGENIVQGLAAAGYVEIAVYAVKKHAAFSRYVHVASRA